MVASRIIIVSGLWFALAGWASYRIITIRAAHVAQLRPESAPNPQVVRPPLKCELAGTKLNEFIAEVQARGALSEGPFDKSPFTIYSVKAVDDGFLVSLGPTEPMTLGGGGLVWVDGETGCLSILRRYQ